MEGMKEYIERAAVHDLVKSLPKYHMFNYDRTKSQTGISPDDVDFGVDKIPAADVVEVRHGRWIPEIHHTYLPVEYDENGFPILHEYTSFRCSLCGRGEPIEEPYCHCGARMDKEADHD